jgi:hypothetical protein
MNQKFSTIDITFKVWNIIDAAISLVMLPFLVLLRAVINKYKIKSYLDLSSSHNRKVALFDILAFLKIIWVIVGLSFFAKFKFSETSKILM